MWLYFGIDPFEQEVDIQDKFFLSCIEFSNITCLTLVVRRIQFNQTNFLGWWYVNVCVFYDIQELDLLDDLSYYSCVYGTPLFVHTKMSCQQGCKACYQPIPI